MVVAPDPSEERFDEKLAAPKVYTPRFGRASDPQGIFP
jgi:hypothetical protein